MYFTFHLYMYNINGRCSNWSGYRIAAFNFSKTKDNATQKYKRFTISQLQLNKRLEKLLETPLASEIDQQTI